MTTCTCPTNGTERVDDPACPAHHPPVLQKLVTAAALLAVLALIIVGTFWLIRGMLR